MGEGTGQFHSLLYVFDGGDVHQLTAHYGARATGLD